MGFERVVDFIKSIGEKEEDDELPDNVTRDKYLRSLRRERRMQREEVEKELLKKQIASYKKEKMRKHLFGLRVVQNKRKNIKKKFGLLQDDGSYFGKGFI